VCSFTYQPPCILSLIIHVDELSIDVVPLIIVTQKPRQLHERNRGCAASHVRAEEHGGGIGGGHVLLDDLDALAEPVFRCKVHNVFAPLYSVELCGGAVCGAHDVGGQPVCVGSVPRTEEVDGGGRGGGVGVEAAAALAVGESGAAGAGRVVRGQAGHVYVVCEWRSHPRRAADRAHAGRAALEKAAKAGRRPTTTVAAAAAAAPLRRVLRGCTRRRRAPVAGGGGGGGAGTGGARQAVSCSLVRPGIESCCSARSNEGSAVW
jgi:hypothetical protein